MTRLVPVDNPRPGQTLLCAGCSRMMPAKQMQADLDGPAFKAYYCRGCAGVTPPSIYEQLKAAGAPLDNHESDLYARVTPTSAEILAGYESLSNVTTFRSQIDGEWWYDIPFAYAPWWERRAK